ncbi:MAG: uracil-DNA glycosylase family protein [Pseudomonadota bacterium]
MSLDLDKRHRAMLREMGIRVWSPMVAMDAAPVAAPHPASAVQPAAARVAEPAVPSAQTVHPPVAIDAVAARARSAPVPGPATPSPITRPQTAPAASAQVLASDSAAWQMGQALALYAETATAGGPRWLVLAETPASARQGDFNPFDGDAGKLLDNMLRAARLHTAGSVMLAPLSRQAGGPDAATVAQSLPALITSAAPDLVLVMGRLASQALLQSTLPFGKLRGQVHSLHGVKLVVTHDAPYLLRNTLDKGKAWDDLCLAMSVFTAA